MTDYSDYAGTWQIDPSHSRLGFVARHAMVSKVRGAFTDFTGTVTIDPTAPQQSTAQVTVQLASIDTGSADRDAHLRGADFFDVANNPEMTFQSTGVRQRGDEFVLSGDLTIKGVTQPLDIELEPTGVVRDPFGNTRSGFSGEATLSRKDYGLTWNVALESGGWLVSDKIKLELDVAAVKLVTEPVA